MNPRRGALAALLAVTLLAVGCGPAAEPADVPDLPTARPETGGPATAPGPTSTPAGGAADVLGNRTPLALPSSTPVPATPTPRISSTPTATTGPSLAAQMLQQHVPTLTPPPETGAASLVFVSEGDGRAEIYRMSADGSSPVRLTDNGRENHVPRWSPDGQLIAYLSSALGEQRPQLYLMAADGSGAWNPLPQFDKIVESVRWSPDGRRLALVANQGPPGETFNGANVYLVNRNGTGLIQLTHMSSSTVGCTSPSWSPDSSMLALRCRSGMQAGVVIVDTAGNTLASVDYFGQVYRVEWLPSGEHLGFIGGMCALGAILVDSLLLEDVSGPHPCLGTDFDRLGLELLDLWEFSWSPLADTHFALQGTDQLQVVDLAGFRGSAFNYHTRQFLSPPSWSPGADRIAFAADGGGDQEIYVIELASGQVQQLTDNQVDDHSPHWRP